MSRLLAALSVLVVLSGCGGDPPAAPGPPSPSTTKSAEAAPVMPELAKEDSKEGAVAFVKYYVRLINHAQATGDTKSLARVEGADCRSCASGRKYLDSIYSRSGSVIGGAIRARVFSALENGPLGGWTVDAELKYGPQTIVRPWRKPRNEELKGGGTIATFFVSRTGTSWLMASWSRAR